MLRICLATLVAFTLAAAVSAQTRTALPQTPIDTAKLTEHVKVLASDDYEGRGPSTPADQKTVDYITKQLAALGVQPGGDRNGTARRWTQDVALVKSNATSPVTATVAIKGATVRWQQGQQIAVR